MWGLNGLDTGVAAKGICGYGSDLDCGVWTNADADALFGMGQPPKYAIAAADNAC